MVMFNSCVQEVLDADDEPLKNKYGEKMERDIVQFVPLKKYVQTNFSLVSGWSGVGCDKSGCSSQVGVTVL